VFAFARAAGMLPLTGTSDAEHMKQDLGSLQITLPAEDVRAIESMAG
jgi:aryl-alcohol dehydrogenase-like predicted oxidoreductase